MMIARTLITPAHLRDQVSNLCWALAGEAGHGMFLRGLYQPVPYVAPPEDPEEDWTPPPKPEPSHYMSTGGIAQEFADALPLTSTGEDGNFITRPADIDTLMAMAEAAGVSVTREALESILSQCDVSDQPWQAAIERLGLSVTPRYSE